jgi:predicted nucleic acid-binding protein
LIEYLLGTDAAEAIGEIIRLPDVDLHVPSLCDVEVAAGLRRAILRGILEEDRAGLALDHYAQMPLTRHGHTTLLPRIFELRSNFSAYDACYVALAERLSASLLTADVRMTRAVKAHTALELLPVAP